MKGNLFGYPFCFFNHHIISAYYEGENALFMSLPPMFAFAVIVYSFYMGVVRYFFNILFIDTNK